MVGELGSKRLKVSALNLFHPTASPLFGKASFSYYDTVSEGEEKGGSGGRWGKGEP
jgi:hypothetical protein